MRPRFLESPVFLAYAVAGLIVLAIVAALLLFDGVSDEDADVSPTPATLHQSAARHQTRPFYS